MAFKCIVFLAVLAYANAGNLLAAPIAHYSPASAVSSSYFQSNALHPVAATYAAAPVATAYAAAPVAVHDQHIGSSSQSVVRSLGGNQAISQYSKAVDSAFSSVRKYDTRITNDALSYAAAPVIAKTYAAPLAPAPLLKTYAAPLAPAPLLKTYAAPLAPAPLIAKTYAAPVAAPVVAKAAIAYSPATVVSHMTFSGLGVEYGW